ncbi:MAG: PHP domain-containing protein [Elainellaceae cyanobacterium]
MAVNLAFAAAAAQFADQDATLLKHIFQTVTAESCPETLNFHMHTVCSDGQLTPEHLIEQALANGLEHFAITDHHTIDGYYRAQKRLQKWISAQPHLGPKSPRLWAGVEINANLLESDVHILCYAFNPDHVAMQPYLQRQLASGTAYQATQVIDAAHAAGGITVLAHPNRYRQAASELIPAAAQIGIDGVETFYAYDNPSPWRPSPRQTHEVYHLAQAYGLLHTCGTDTHGMSLLRRL